MDENHADTANTLDDIASQQPPQASDAPVPTTNPSTVTDPSGNTIILNEGPNHTANIPSTPTPSKQGPDIQK